MGRVTPELTRIIRRRGGSLALSGLLTAAALVGSTDSVDAQSGRPCPRPASGRASELIISANAYQDVNGNGRYDNRPGQPAIDIDRGPLAGRRYTVRVPGQPEQSLMTDTSGRASAVVDSRTADTTDEQGRNAVTVNVVAEDNQTEGNIKVACGLQSRTLDDRTEIGQLVVIGTPKPSTGLPSGAIDTDQGQRLASVTPTSASAPASTPRPAATAAPATETPRPAATAAPATETPKPLPTVPASPTVDVAATANARADKLEADATAAAKSATSTAENNDKSTKTAILATSTAAANTFATATAVTGTQQARATGTAIQAVNDEASNARRELETSKINDFFTKALIGGVAVAAIVGGVIWYRNRRHNNAVERETSRIEALGDPTANLERRSQQLLTEVTHARLRRDYRIYSNRQVAAEDRVATEAIPMALMLAAAVKDSIGQDLANARGYANTSLHPVLKRMLVDIETHEAALAGGLPVAEDVIARKQAAKTAIEAAITGGHTERIAAYDAARAVEVAMHNLQVAEPGHELFTFDRNIDRANRT